MKYEMPEQEKPANQAAPTCRAEHWERRRPRRRVPADSPGIPPAQCLARQDRPGWADLGEIKRNWTQKNINAPRNIKTAMPNITGSAGTPAGEILPTPPRAATTGAPRQSRDIRAKNAKTRQIATRK
jgi:hypothetical protein